MAKRIKDISDVKGPVLVIDLRFWTTQSQHAEGDQRRFAQIRQQVKRRLSGKSSPLQESDLLEVKELGITLIRRNH